MKTFTKIFILFAWILAIVTKGGRASALILMAAGLWALIETIEDWRKNNAKR